VTLPEPMTLPRALLVVPLALATLELPAGASSAPASTSFKIVGYEYAFTSTVGSFAGHGSGDAGGTAYWNATVKHDRLGSDPTYVNGGSFAMAIRGPGSSVDSASPLTRASRQPRHLRFLNGYRTKSVMR
jgi:hypothetical protein